MNDEVYAKFYSVDWHSWKDTDYDELAGALIAGHLIECSGYVTGSNFAGFYEYPLDDLYDITFGIAEVDKDGTCVATKHDAKNGFVTEDTVKCQFLYELQGNVYLNSDVKAILDNVQVKAESKNRYETPIAKHHSHDYYILNTIPESVSGASKAPLHPQPPNSPSSTKPATNPKSSSTPPGTAPLRNSISGSA
jgi:hypothetical protein